MADLHLQDLSSLCERQQRDDALALWGRVRGAADALSEASESYIAHLREGHGHGTCRRQVAPGSYTCGMRLDYLDALNAYRKARGFADAEGR